MDNNNILILLLQQKLGLLSAVTEPLMLWWVSSVVFCGSVLSSVWIKRNEVVKIPGLNWFFIINTFAKNRLTK